MPDRHMRILIADDEPLMRRAIRGLLARKENWEICGEASDGLEAIERTEQLRPDVVVMDLFMPRLNGLDATRSIRQSFPGVKVLILTLDDFPDLKRLTRDAGALACVLKAESSRHLIPVIESLSNT